MCTLAVLHNVAIHDGAHADENGQFIQLSFTMPEMYTAAGDELIPFASVRVGKASNKDGRTGNGRKDRQPRQDKQQGRQDKQQGRQDKQQGEEDWQQGRQDKQQRQQV